VAGNISTILDAVADALESATPDTRPNVTFKRWRGPGLVESAPLPGRERAFQMRLGASKPPRSKCLSSSGGTWHRADLLVVIGYDFGAPRATDTGGLGVHQLAWDDHKQVLQKLCFGNPLSAVSGVKRMVFLGADSPGPTSRTYRFDCEWAE
jgi:hypothetical protein